MLGVKNKYEACFKLTQDVQGELGTAEALIYFEAAE